MKSVKKTLKKYFIPHPENDHKPHFLRVRAVTTMAAIVVMLFFASIVGNYIVTNNEHLAAIQAAFLVDLTNEDRAEEGLPKLAINDKLVAAAGMKAGDMSDKGYFAHVSPDGKTPWYWIEQAEYPYLYAGENLAVNFYDSEDVEDAWMDSPTHKANIMSRNFAEIGIATARGTYKGEKTTFVVQMFGSQRKQKVAVVAQPEPVATQEEVVTEESDNVLGSTIEVVPTPPILTPVPLVEEPVATTEQTSFITFTNPEAESFEAVAPAASAEVPTYTSWFERVIVNPIRTVDGLYSAIAALVIFALVLKIFIEIRLQHPRNIIYGLLLLAITIVCMHLNGTMLAEPTLVVAF